jgi:hypothetical protein
MVLRDHPLMTYDGHPRWPPAWIWVEGLDNNHHRQGEIGILRKLVPSNIEPADRCFLYIDYEGSSYIGCLLIEDYDFCSQIVKLLQDCLNRPIVEIGGVDLSYTL